MNAHGRSFLITGSTDGIGLHTAQRLAGLDAWVLVHGRSEARVHAAVSAIRIEAANRYVSGHAADFTSFAAIRRLAEEVRAQHPRINVLVNNAGVYCERRQLSEDGFENTWAVNVLAPYLLTALLLPHVTDRILNVTSSHAAAHLDFSNLQGERSYDAHAAYAQSALCSMLFTFELARRLKAAGSSVTANCLDPGTVNTKLLDAGWGPVGINLKDANDELVIATDPSLQAVSGAFFVSKSRWPPPPIANDTATQQRLWGLLEEQTGLPFPI